jgi:hypothetical protein
MLSLKILPPDDAVGIWDTCPSGWTPSSVVGAEKCFRLFYDERISWMAAQARCRREGGQLAEPLSQTEQEVLERMRQSVDGPVIGGGVWIGVSDIAAEGSWVVSFGCDLCGARVEISLSRV